MPETQTEENTDFKEQYIHKDEQLRARARYIAAYPFSSPEHRRVTRGARAAASLYAMAVRNTSTCKARAHVTTMLSPLVCLLAARC